MISKHEPHILIIGAPQTSVVKSLYNALRGLSLSLITACWRTHITERITAQTQAIIVTPCVRAHRLSRILYTIRAASPHASELPIFVLVRKSRDAAVQRLYQASATAVFQWPEVGPLFCPAFVRLMAAHQTRGHPKTPEEALKRTLEARLFAVGSLPNPGVIRLALDGGVVHISGSVSSLEVKRNLSSHLEKVSGVSSVSVRGVRVGPTLISDATLQQQIYARLEKSGFRERHSIGLSAVNGHVTLTGSVESPEKRERIEALVASCNGIRGLESYLVVSREQLLRDSETAARLRRAFERDDTPPQGSLRLAVVDGLAVLRGSLGGSGDRRRLTTLLGRDKDVQTVLIQTPPRDASLLREST